MRYVLNMKKVRFDPNTMLYIGRGPNKCDMLNTEPFNKGWLGNPVIIGKLCIVCGGRHNNGGDTLPCYRVTLKQRLKDPKFVKAINKVAMEYKDLVCWCKPNPCHGDILVNFFDAICLRKKENK